ncbi:unnamed protein product [Euphydryas editha]|uniref:Uncharacterized protein n=1 Tax=Euphydryas editha TaxID=104508 RepID=A0AAU9TD07_EUPED|nr:unnamed protein product [Euphydryas editha]
MGPFLYFALSIIQLSSIFASEQIPLKCFLQDYNFFNIFDTSAVKTSSEVVPKTHSLHFDTVTVNSAGFDKDGWKHDATNIKYQGLDDAILDDFGFNFTAKVLQLTFHTDMVVTYDYKSSGSLFSTPMDGEGFAEVSLKNIQVSFTMPFDIKEDNAKKYIELKSFNYWYDIKDNAELKFSSLTNANKVLSNSIEQQINQRWKYITAHFGKVFYDSLAEEIFNVLKNYVKNFPLKSFGEC